MYLKKTGDDRLGSIVLDELQLYGLIVGICRSRSYEFSFECSHFQLINEREYKKAKRKISELTIVVLHILK